jgi:small-conductance mechanosensitive channel
MVAVFTVLSQVGLNVTSLVTTSAVLTAVIGFALQDLLSSVMSGIALQLEQPFAVGDWVKFDEQEGRILETNWRSTKIETLPRDIVVIPNNVITRSPLINFTAPDPIHRRKIKIGLSYDAPPNRVKKALLAGLREVDGVLTEPRPFVLARSYDDFAISYKLFFFIDQIHLKDHIEDAVMSRIWYQLKREGLKVPFPIRDINMYTVSAEDVQRARDVERVEVEEARSAACRSSSRSIRGSDASSRIASRGRPSPRTRRSSGMAIRANRSTSWPAGACRSPRSGASRLRCSDAGTISARCRS